MSKRPAVLSAAAIIEGLEGATVLAVGCYLGILAMFGHPHDVASAVVLCVTALAAGVGIAFTGRGLWQVRRWGRAPALLTQVFALIVAVSLFQSHRQILGGILALVALAGVATLLSPPATRALVDD